MKGQARKWENPQYIWMYIVPEDMTEALKQLRRQKMRSSHVLDFLEWNVCDRTIQYYYSRPKARAGVLKRGHLLKILIY